MTPKKFYLLLLLFLIIITGYGQSTPVRWWNPAKNSFPAIEGQGWTTEVNETYSRLPVRAEKTVSSDLWKLSKNSAGLVVRFKTDAEQITIRYQVEGEIALPHMPATGVSGIDLYGVDSSNNYLWSAGKYAFKDTIEYKFINLKPVKVNPATGIEYRLYLPLYNAVKWLEIGTPQESNFIALPIRQIKPMVVYGTSIAQGACASRPGMAWTAILSRQVNLPLINLGFSGTGRLDKQVIDLINEIDASVYILDCLPNLTGGKVNFSEAEIYTRIVNAVKEIRQLHPETPVVLTDHFGYTDALINPVKRAEYIMVNNINHKAFAALKSAGIKHVSLLPMEALQQDMDTMVDGIHPTDLGMLRYANAYKNLLIKILAKKPF